MLEFEIFDSIINKSSTDVRYRDNKNNNNNNNTHLRRSLMLLETKATESLSVLVSSLCMNCWDDTNSSRGFRRVVTMRYGGVTSCRKSAENKTQVPGGEGRSVCVQRSGPLERLFHSLDVDGCFFVCREKNIHLQYSVEDC